MIVGTANLKGGVGKSAIAVHFAAWLKKQNRSVIFVDSDPAGTSYEWIQEAAPEIKALHLEAYEDILKILPALQSEAEFVIADGPAGLTEAARAILIHAELALLPVGPCLSDLKALMKSVDKVKQIQGLRNDGLPKIIVVPTRIRNHMPLTRQLFDTLRQHNLPIGDGLSEREAYPYAVGHGTLVWNIETKSARQATAELEYFFQELLKYADEYSKALNGGRVASETAAGRP